MSNMLLNHKAKGWLALAGMAGGVYWLLLHTFLNPNWGPPGTSSYLGYEAFNRLWPPGLLLMMLGFVAFYSLSQSKDSRLLRVGFRAVMVGFVMMIVGNIAEFWFFSTASYRDASRNIAYMTFFIGLLLMLVGTTGWGIGILKNRTAPRWCAGLLLILLPLTLLSFFTGSLPQFSLLIVVIALSGFTLLRSKVPIPVLTTDTI